MTISLISLLGCVVIPFLELKAVKYLFKVPSGLLEMVIVSSAIGITAYIRCTRLALQAMI